MWLQCLDQFILNIVRNPSDYIFLLSDSLSVFLKRPYGLFENKLHRLFLSIGISCFVWFMLFSLGIFEFDYFPPVQRFGITGVYSFFCFVSLAINFFLIQDFVIKKRTYGNTILWCFWLLEGIALSNFLLTTRLYKWEVFTFKYFLVIQTFTIALGMIIIPLLILIHYIFVLKTRLSEIALIRNENSHNPSFSNAGEIIQIESDYKNDSFSIELNRLLYIKSADNYADVYYIEGENRKVSHKLIRNTLTGLEQKQINPSLVRCHRSYIVNKNHQKWIRQTSDGNYFIVDFTDEEIPISRKYKGHFSTLR